MGEEQDRISAFGTLTGKDGTAPYLPRGATVGTQSDYRESEAQTLPYTPQYTVKQGENPEILTLGEFKFAQGLPAGLAEVEQIEKAREKRVFEQSLPPLHDGS